MDSQQQLIARVGGLAPVRPGPPRQVRLEGKRLTWVEPQDTRYVTHYLVRIGSDASTPKARVSVGQTSVVLAEGDANFWVSAYNEPFELESPRAYVAGKVNATPVTGGSGEIDDITLSGDPSITWRIDGTIDVEMLYEPATAEDFDGVVPIIEWADTHCTSPGEQPYNSDPEATPPANLGIVRFNLGRPVAQTIHVQLLAYTPTIQRPFLTWEDAPAGRTAEIVITQAALDAHLPQGVTPTTPTGVTATITDRPQSFYLELAWTPPTNLEPIQGYEAQARAWREDDGTVEECPWVTVDQIVGRGATSGLFGPLPKQPGNRWWEVQVRALGQWGAVSPWSASSTLTLVLPALPLLFDPAKAPQNVTVEVVDGANPWEYYLKFLWDLPELPAGSEVKWDCECRFWDAATGGTADSEWIPLGAQEDVTLTEVMFGPFNRRDAVFHVEGRVRGNNPINEPSLWEVSAARTAIAAYAAPGIPTGITCAVSAGEDSPDAFYITLGATAPDPIGTVEGYEWAAEFYTDAAGTNSDSGGKILLGRNVGATEVSHRFGPFARRDGDFWLKGSARSYNRAGGYSDWADSAIVALDPYPPPPQPSAVTQSVSTIKGQYYITVTHTMPTDKGTTTGYRWAVKFFTAADGTEPADPELLILGQGSDPDELTAVFGPFERQPDNYWARAQVLAINAENESSEYMVSTTYALVPAVEAPAVPDSVTQSVRTAGEQYWIDTTHHMAAGSVAPTGYEWGCQFFDDAEATSPANPEIITLGVGNDPLEWGATFGPFQLQIEPYFVKVRVRSINSINGASEWGISATTAAVPALPLPPQLAAVSCVPFLDGDNYGLDWSWTLPGDVGSGVSTERVLEVYTHEEVNPLYLEAEVPTGVTASLQLLTSRDGGGWPRPEGDRWVRGKVRMLDYRSRPGAWRYGDLVNLEQGTSGSGENTGDIVFPGSDQYFTKDGSLYPSTGRVIIRKGYIPPYIGIPPVLSIGDFQGAVGAVERSDDPPGVAPEESEQAYLGNADAWATPPDNFGYLQMEVVPKVDVEYWLHGHARSTKRKIGYKPHAFESADNLQHFTFTQEEIDGFGEFGGIEAPNPPTGPTLSIDNTDGQQYGINFAWHKPSPAGGTVGYQLQFAFNTVASWTPGEGTADTDWGRSSDAPGLATEAWQAQYGKQDQDYYIKGRIRAYNNAPTPVYSTWVEVPGVGQLISRVGIQATPAPPTMSSGTTIEIFGGKRVYGMICYWHDPTDLSFVGGLDLEYKCYSNDIGTIVVSDWAPLGHANTGTGIPDVQSQRFGGDWPRLLDFLYVEYRIRSHNVARTSFSAWVRSSTDAGGGRRDGLVAIDPTAAPPSPTGLDLYIDTALRQGVPSYRFRGMLSPVSDVGTTKRYGWEHAVFDESAATEGDPHQITKWHEWDSGPPDQLQKMSPWYACDATTGYYGRIRVRPYNEDDTPGPSKYSPVVAIPAGNGLNFASGDPSTLGSTMGVVDGKLVAGASGFINPDFNQGLIGYSLFGSVAIDNSVYDSAPNSARLTGPLAGVEQRPGCLPGDTVVARVKVRNAASSAPVVGYLDALNSAGGLVQRSNLELIYPNAGAWQLMTLRMTIPTTPNTTTRVAVHVNMDFTAISTDRAWIDTFSYDCQALGKGLTVDSNGYKQLLIDAGFKFNPTTGKLQLDLTERMILTTDGKLSTAAINVLNDLAVDPAIFSKADGQLKQIGIATEVLLAQLAIITGAIVIGGNSSNRVTIAPGGLTLVGGGVTASLASTGFTVAELWAQAVNSGVFNATGMFRLFSGGAPIGSWDGTSLTAGVPIYGTRVYGVQWGDISGRPSSYNQSEISGLEARLAAIESRLDALEA